MSEIPYFFDTPIPRYFRETGWFENEHMFKFINWAFTKCQNIPHKETYYGKEILLAPFEFIAGRLSSPKECFLSENIFRNQIKIMINAGLLTKTNNSLKNKYSCYVWNVSKFSKPPHISSTGQEPTDNQQCTSQLTNRITNSNNSYNISTDALSDINNQQNNQQITNRQPTNNHKERKERKRKNHHPYPSSFRSFKSDDEMIDDFSSKIEKIEVYQGVFLTKSELELCVEIKGSLEKVKDCIKHIMEDKKRKFDITDWPNALANWKISNKAKAVIEDNLSYADKLCETFLEFINGNGWRCYMYHDRNKDQKGVLFEPQSSYLQAVFVSVSDREFKQKCFTVLKEKNMLRSILNKG